MKKVNWYINRLLLMSTVEIIYRIKEKAKKVYEKFFSKDSLYDVHLSDKKTNWFFGVDDKNKIVHFFSRNDFWNEKKVKELIAHNFSFFSFERKFLGSIINWHRDYKNNKEAPLKYYKDINYQKFPEVGDFKYIWEINRHQHLILLSKAYFLTDDQDYKDEVIKQILSWVESNPYKKGINWLSPLELGIRLITWSWVWSFLGDLDKEFKNIWLKSIYKHCRHIYQNFSRYSSANNHLIGEAAGLFIASVVWPFEKKSEAWQKKSFNILVNEIEKQNYEDGVNKEQSISYQQFVLDFFILAGLLGEKNGLAFPESYWEQIEKMIEFIASIMNKNGEVPNIGDSDDGYAVILSGDNNFNPFKSLLATGAVLFKRCDLKKKAERFDEKSIWLLGIDGLEQFNELDNKKSVPIKKFEKGGYYILSAYEGTENEIMSIFDCGPLGYLSIAAHGHADMLSFTLNLGGTKFLIDPGTYVYQNPKDWRDYFKGTAAHNTIRIDGQNQSIIAGNFMWHRKAQAKLLKWESNNEYDLVKAEHNGYIRLKDPVIHQREMIFFKKNRVFKITDRINAQKKHYIEQYFHFSKECILSELQPKELKIRNNNIIVNMKLDKKLSTKIISGSVDPIMGWESRKFDVITKTTTVLSSIVHTCPCELETMIVISKPGEKNAN